MANSPLCRRDLDHTWDVVQKKLSENEALEKKILYGRQLSCVVLRVHVDDKEEAQEFVQGLQEQVRKNIEVIPEGDEVVSSFHPSPESGATLCQKIGPGAVVFPGDLISLDPYKLEYGTLGVILEDENDKLIGITAGHNLLPGWQPDGRRFFCYQCYPVKVNSEVMWIDEFEVVQTKRPIANQFGALFETNSQNKFVDAAHFSVLRHIAPEEICLNFPTGERPASVFIGKSLLEMTAGRDLHKHGLTTKLTSGRIVEEDQFWVPADTFPRHRLPGFFYIIGNDNKPFSEKGDSGSVIFDDNGMMYGLVIGDTKNRRLRNGEEPCPMTACIRMDTILRHLHKETTAKPSKTEGRPGGGNGLDIRLNDSKKNSVTESSLVANQPGTSTGTRPPTCTLDKDLPETEIMKEKYKVQELKKDIKTLEKKLMEKTKKKKRKEKEQNFLKLYLKQQQFYQEQQQQFYLEEQQQQNSPENSYTELLYDYQSTAHDGENNTLEVLEDQCKNSDIMVAWVLHNLLEEEENGLIVDQRDIEKYHEFALMDKYVDTAMKELSADKVKEVVVASCTEYDAEKHRQEKTKSVLVKLVNDVAPSLTTLQDSRNRRDSYNKLMVNADEERPAHDLTNKTSSGNVI